VRDTALSFTFFKIMQFLDNVRVQDQSAPVTLLFNEESYEVPAENALNKSVSQLFAEYGVNLGADPARLTRYIINGEVVPGTTVVRPGESIRSVISSESKGQN
jgi:hypothetical protein